MHLIMDHTRTKQASAAAVNKIDSGFCCGKSCRWLFLSRCSSDVPKRNWYLCSVSIREPSATSACLHCTILIVCALPCRYHTITMCRRTNKIKKIQAVLFLKEREKSRYNTRLRVRQMQGSLVIDMMQCRMTIFCCCCVSRYNYSRTIIYQQTRLTSRECKKLILVVVDNFH